MSISTVSHTIACMIDAKGGIRNPSERNDIANTVGMVDGSTLTKRVGDIHKRQSPRLSTEARNLEGDGTAFNQSTK